MTNLDDRPLERTPPVPPGLEPPPPPGRPPVALIIVGLLLLAVAGFGARWWFTERAARDAAAVESPAPRPPGGGVEAPLAETPPVELPPLDEMDAFIRGLLGALSARPELARWLATDDLIRHLAVTIERVSRGLSPAQELGPLAPADPFVAASRQRRYFVDPASYRRYDGMAATIGSMDMAAVARAYRTIQPRLNEAYRAMGRPDADVDRAVAAGLTLLLETPVPPESAELQFGDGPNYVYSDPALEGLLPAQKHLLRMGPDHVRTIKGKLGELSSALRRP
jgi:hypothetical protein